MPTAALCGKATVPPASPATTTARTTLSPAVQEQARRGNTSPDAPYANGLKRAEAAMRYGKNTYLCICNASRDAAKPSLSIGNAQNNYAL